MAVSVNNLPCLCLSYLPFVLDIATTIDEHFWHMHGEVLRCMEIPTKSSGSFEEESPRNVQQGAG